MKLSEVPRFFNWSLAALFGMFNDPAIADGWTPRAERQDGGSFSRMRRLEPSLVRRTAGIADAMIFILAGCAALATDPALLLRPLRVTSLFAAAAILLCYILITKSRIATIQQFVRVSGPRRVCGGVSVAALPFALALALTFAFMPSDNAGSRVSFLRWQGTWAFFAVLGIAFSRILFSILISRWRARGSLTRRIAIVGHGLLAGRLLEWLQSSCADMIELVGIFDDRTPGRSATLPIQRLVRGTTDDLVELAREIVIDRVFVALPHSADRRLLTILRKLKQMPVNISLAPDLAGFATAVPGSGDFGGLPLLKVSGRFLGFWERIFKGGFDRLVAATAMLALLPVFLVIAIALRLDSRGPVLFRQARHGFGNKVIMVYKFRTMYVELTDHGGERQVEQDDERVTRIGWLLRQTSVDEFPQLLNVLRGEMSLVGPRPLPIRMRVQEKLNHEIVSEYALRHHVKPGITGWAQVNGYRGPVQTADALRARVAHDLFYIENWSIWLDIRILLKTPGVAFGRDRTT